MLQKTIFFEYLSILQDCHRAKEELVKRDFVLGIKLREFLLLAVWVDIFQIFTNL